MENQTTTPASAAFGWSNLDALQRAQFEAGVLASTRGLPHDSVEAFRASTQFAKRFQDTLQGQVTVTGLGQK